MMIDHDVRVTSDNDSRPPVDHDRLKRQMAELLALERTFPLGRRTVYENGVERDLPDSQSITQK